MEETTFVQENESVFLSRTAGAFLVLFLLCSAAVVGGYFVGDRLFGDLRYAAALPHAGTEPVGLIRFYCTALRGTILQCAWLFIGGLLVYPLIIPALLAVYRGFCLGCVLFLYMNSLAIGWGIPLFLSLYFAVSVCMLLFSSLSYTKQFQQKQYILHRGMANFSAYFCSFLTFSGIVFVLACTPYMIPFFY